MRLGLSERIAIEAGLYRRASFAEIARQIGVSTKTVSQEIRKNQTLSPAAKFNGKDCRFAAECNRQFVCKDPRCSFVDCHFEVPVQGLSSALKII